jgi:hypothetical protein
MKRAACMSLVLGTTRDGESKGRPASHPRHDAPPPLALPLYDDTEDGSSTPFEPVAHRSGGHGFGLGRPARHRRPH